MADITNIDIETKIYQLIDSDLTLFEDEYNIFKRVLQYNPISKVYVVIKYDTIQKSNTVICITKKQTVAAKMFNEVFS